MESKLDDRSPSIPLPRFDLFSILPLQDTIEKHLVTEHKPISALDSSSFVQFEIQTAFDEYLDLSKLFLYLKLQYKESTTKKWVEIDWINLTHAPNFMHSMIKQVDIFIGSNQISSSSPTYAYKAYIETLLGFSENAKKSHLTSVLWDKTNDLPFTPFELFGRLHSDLVFQDRVILGGVKLTIRILFNDPKFYFEYKKNYDKKYEPTLKFLDASVRALRYKVSPEIVRAHDKALALSPAKYILSASRVKPFTINKGLTDAHIDNLHSGQLPRRLFVMFVWNGAFNGEYVRDPLYFQHFHLSSICLYVNGEQIPPKPFTPDFENKLYIRELLSLYDALDMLDGDTNFNINRDNYAKGNVIIGFNLSPDYSNGPLATQYFNIIKYGSMSLSLRFAKGLEDTITCLVYFEFDKILEIDINREAKVDFY